MFDLCSDKIMKAQIVISEDRKGGRANSPEEEIF